MLTRARDIWAILVEGLKSNQQSPITVSTSGPCVESPRFICKKQPQLALTVLRDAHSHGLWLLEHHPVARSTKALEIVDAFIAQSR